MLFLFSAAAAEEKSSVIIDIDNTPERKTATLEDAVNFFIDTAKHFDSQYPGDKINQDFHEDVAKYFPESTPQEIYDYQRYIRSGINIYRFAKNLFNQYIEARLTPEEPPLIVKDSEYDLSSPDTPYIEPQDDEALIIQDFKKVISYGNSPREIKAYRAKLATEGEKKGKMRDFEELGYIFSKLDFKKILFYNIFYGSPLTGNRGIGKWDIQKDVKLRLITIQTGVKENQEIEGVIHIFLPPKTFVTAVDNGDYFKPQINFEKSDNLKSIEYTLPLPRRLKNMDKDWSVYVGEIAIPFAAEVKDSSQNLLLEASIKLNYCNQNYQCETLDFQPMLTLKTGFGRDSSVATYIRMVFDFLKPLPQSELKIIHFNTEKTADGKSMLTAVLEAPENIETFSTFISNSKKITFERPRINIDDQTAIVRWLSTDPTMDLSKISYEITTEVNQKYILRQDLVPTDEKMPFTPYLPSLTAVLLMAFVSGLLLNFMPNVLPLWLFKISSLSGFGFQKDDSMNKNILYSFLGTALTFFCAVVSIVTFSKTQSTFFWGTQFQIIWLVIPVTFLVLIEIAHGWKLINLSVFSSPTTDKYSRLKYFLSGILMAASAFFITVPFMAEFWGFALHTSWWKLLTVFTSFFAGFAFIYLILFYFPYLLTIIPAPGPWVKKCNRFALFMLYLALLWLFFIIYSMSNIGFCIRFVFYISLFWALLGIRYIALNLNYENLPYEMRKIAARRMGAFFAACVALVGIITVSDGIFAADGYKQKLSQNYKTDINEKQIETLIRQGKTVLVMVEADWNPVCRYNQWVVLNNPELIKTIEKNNVHIVRSNWLISSEQTKKLMEKFHQFSLPAYILFSPMVPDGLILPQILNAQRVGLLIDNISLPQVATDAADATTSNS